jgi:predicted transposase/invertase (TIGR01784 family)
MENIFENNLPVHTFENICIEDGLTKLNDRSYKHFFIAPTCAKMIEDKEARSFFEFLISNKAQTGYTSDLSKYVADAKRNTQWRLQYMTVETLERYAYENGLEQGIATGAQQKAVETAKRLLADGKYTIKEISSLLGIPIESFTKPVTLQS